MEKSIKKTGGQVDNLVFALVDSAYDKKEDVRHNISRAVHQLGKKRPGLVLSTCNNYLCSHPKLVQGHRVLILEITTKIIKDVCADLPLDLAKELVLLASSELTKSKDIVPEWQSAASDVLVALGAHFSQEVMVEMLQKITPGKLPHYFIILTLANFARENVFGVVPFLKDIFSRMVSMLGSVKADNMRWVLATCYGSFSEAILEYCANIENAPFPDIAKDRFHGEIFTAFEIMFNVWLNSSRDAKVRLAIVDAFGHMSLLLPKDKLEEHIQRIVQGITNLYKRHTEHHLITQSLCMVLSSACSGSSLMLLPFLDQIMNGLHVQACIEPDYTNPSSVKNHNEVLRCFQVLTQSFSDKVVGFLQQKLETQQQDKFRAGTISIIKHIVNSADEHLSTKKEVLLTSLCIVLHDPNLKVLKSFSQCVIALAHHDYLLLEGGDKMIDFIVRMCSLTEEDKTLKRVIESDGASVASVKGMCENILQLMATTVGVVEDVLWPYLIEFILPRQYTSAMMALCRALAVIATNKKEAEDDKFLIDYSVSVNVPKAQALFARLIVLTGHPLKGNNRALHILHFLKAYSPNISENMSKMLDTVIPKLTLYLEENSHNADSWNQKAWEDLILKLLSKSLSEVDSEEWLLALGREMGEQIPLYAGCHDEKNFLYKCLGVILRKIGTTDFIREHLNLVFDTVDHNNQTECEGCAVGVGFCAASHLDQCLMKLEELTKTRMVRKATGFMGLLKDKSEAEVERVKSTVMLCYGYVVFYGSPGLVSSRMESNVLRVINPHFGTVRDANVKQNLIRAVELFGKALRGPCESEAYIFTRRADLLKHMQSFLKSEPRNTPSECRSLAIDAITNLVKLKPPLGDEDEQEIIIVCSSNVYPVNYAQQQTNKLSEVESEKLMSQAVESISTLLCVINSRELSPARLQTMLKLLEPYVVSKHNHERERVMVTIKELLSNYLNLMASNTDVHFSTLGQLLGSLLPRCTDPVLSVRQNSVECVQLLLVINDRYEGVPANVNDERIQGLIMLKESLVRNDPAVLFTVVNQLSMVVSKKTPDTQVRTLVYSLVQGLCDVHNQSSSGACAILNCLMKFRGGELNQEVSTIVQSIVRNLTQVTFTQTTTGSLVALRTLASHHLIQVLRTVLEYPVPWNSTVRSFWKTLAHDKDLTCDTFEHLLDTLLRTAPFTEQEQPKNKLKTQRIAMPLAVSVCAAMTELFREPETESLVVEMFPKLLAVIFIRMGSSVGVSTGGAKKDQVLLKESTECLQLFIERSKYSSLLQYLNDNEVWTMLQDEETFTDGLQKVVVGICEHHPGIVNEVVSSLLPSLSSMYDNQRMVPAAVFAEMMNQRCCGDTQLVELLMNSLLSKLVDPSHVVRKLCIRGLGNVASVGGQKLQVYSTTILSAMMAAMDDKEDPEMCITLEAIAGLQKILELLEETSVRQILINICLRIRPCFEKENASVRASSISLFGNLARFGYGPSETAFLEQIHTNFVSILLHLNEETEVTKACKGALRMIGPRLNCLSINDMFQKHLIEGGQLHYGEFMNDLSRLIIEDRMDKTTFYAMACVSFFKSNWPEVRANAALFTGFLLGCVKREEREAIPGDHICSALVVLLKDPSPVVRSRASEAISLLHDY